MTMTIDQRQLKADPLETQRTIDDGHQAQIHTAMPGHIVAFNANAMTATVQLGIKGIRTKKDGTREQVTISQLQDVPVLFHGGGGHTLTLPISPDDECLVVFAERSIDNWWQQGGVQDSTDWRMHDINDGFAIVGLRSTPNVLGAGGTAPITNTSTVQLRSNDGKTVVQVDGPNKAITLYANGASEAVVFVDGANQAITLQCQSSITLNCPTVTINGELHVSGEIIGKYGGASVTVTQHRHPGVGQPPTVGTMTVEERLAAIEARLAEIEKLAQQILEAVTGRGTSGGLGH